MHLVSASILSADFSNILNVINELYANEVDMLHLDVMDGHFVPNISFGAPIISSIRPHTRLKFDTHLMIANPYKYVQDFVNAGSEIITVHSEITNDLENTLKLIRSLGCKVGLAFNPTTNISPFVNILPLVDQILIMSVEPGFGGQQFNRSILDKISFLKGINNQFIVAVDGGVNDVTGKECLKAGADILVVGSYLFKGNLAQNIKTIKQL